MIQIDNTLVSDELLEKQFVCDLSKCKGACCEEGDVGAPISLSEIAEVEKNIDAIKKYMTPVGLKLLQKKGFYEPEPAMHPAPKQPADPLPLVTTTIQGRDCVFAARTAQGVLQCSIEQAYNQGESTIKKPISCYLYPVRITPHTTYDAVNYDQWHICADACTLGKSLQMPVYQFVKAPLIQKYGKEWYNALHTYYLHKTNTLTPKITS